MFLLIFTGAAHHCEADPDSASYWKRQVWRGVAQPVEGGEGSSESLLHSRGSQLVQGDRDLPNRAYETREHTRYTSRHSR